MKTMLVGLAVGTALVSAITGEACAQATRANTIVIAQNFDAQSLWPNATTASDNLNAGNAIVESLFWQDPRSGKTMPLLAENYRLTAPATVEIKLRRGIAFTNGEPMNADAVVHSINVFLDPKATPAYAIYAGSIKGASKVDDYTVTLELKFPYPAIELLLTQFHITPPKYFTEAGAAAYGQKPIGTGPFMLTEWIKDNRIVMDRNPKYWGTLPKGIERLIWRPVPDETARAAGLEVGEFDIAGSLPITAVQRLEGRNELTIHATPSYRIFQLILSSLDAHASPLKDKRVRQAINYAIDKDSIIKNLFFGRAAPLSGQLLRKEQVGFDPSLKDYPYDPAKAKSLLAEAGHPNGFEIVFKFPSGRYAQDREVSEAIAGMLQAVGIRTKMTVLEPGEFLRQLRNKELWPMAYLGLAPLDDPDFQMSQYRSTWRYAYVNNPEIDALVDAGAREIDVTKRTDAYRRLMKLMHDEAPVAFLFQGYDFWGTSKRIDGFVPRGDQRFFFSGLGLR
jgi:peptide/nickel transport system substrate-binding protein